jgi:hypothetical protein
MMAEFEPLAFLDGTPLSGGGVCIISARWGYEDTDDRPTRLLFFREGKFCHIDLPANVISVATVGEGANEDVVALARDGRAFVIHGVQVEEEIICPEYYGPMCRLHECCGVVYACGIRGQIYRRQASGWSHMDKGVFDPIPSVDSEQLRDIGGSDETNLYVVGSFGSLLKYEGRRWIRCDSPTNVHLEQVVMANDQTVWVCGERGVLLHGSGLQHWSVVDSGISDNLWGMAWFAGRIYLAGFDGLWVYGDGGVATAVDMGLNPPPTTYRLAADAEGRLWSFGLTDVTVYDGVSWNRLEYDGSEPL